MELFAKTKQTAFSRYLFLQNALFPVFDRALNTTPAMIIKAFKTAKFTGRSSDRYSVKKKKFVKIYQISQKTPVFEFFKINFQGFRPAILLKRDDFNHEATSHSSML